MNLFIVAWRNLGRNRRRTLLSLSAIAVAAMTITFLFSLLGGMEADLASNLINLFNGEVRVRHESYGKYERFNPLHLRVTDAEAVVDALKSSEGVDAVSPRISFPGAVFKDESSFGLQGRGMDFSLEREYQDLEQILVRGTLPDNREAEGRRVPAAVGTGVAERLGLEIGDSFTVLATTMSRGSNAMTFQVSGILDFPVSGLNNGTFLAPLSAVRRLLRMEDSATEILVKSAEGYTPEETAGVVSRTLARFEQREELSVQPWTEIQSTYSFMEIARVSYSFVALFFFILGSTVIINTIMMTVFERKQEIGTLSALGMDSRRITRLFFYEAAIMSFLGSLLGVVVGSLIVLPLSEIGLDFSQAMEGVSMEVSEVLYPVWRLSTCVAVLLASTVIACIASYVPVRGVSRIEPVEALRAE